MGEPSGPTSAPRTLGRYAIFGEIASGGMAVVHLGRLLGPVGFARTVAVKMLHPHLAKDPEFAAMFLDEARVAARVRHPNVVSTLDVVALPSELFLVMDYVHGESLSSLARAARRRGEVIPARIIVAVLAGVLHGLHAAHEATSELGEPLGIAHRDVSPQNVLVGADGVPRVLDFGIAKAAGRLSSTRAGLVKGKVGYMSPEQLEGRDLDRRTDIYSAAVVLWELLAGQRLFEGDNEYAVADLVKKGGSVPPSSFGRTMPRELDEVALRGLSRDARDRFATAREMALALERSGPVAIASEIADWVEKTAGVELAARARTVAEVEEMSARLFREPVVEASQPPAAREAGRAGAEARAALDPDPEGEAVTVSGGRLLDATEPEFDPPTLPLSQEGAATSMSAVRAIRANAPPAASAPRRRFILAGSVGALLGLLGAVWITRAPRSTPVHPAAEPLAPAQAAMAVPAEAAAPEQPPAQPASASAPNAAPGGASSGQGAAAAPGAVPATGSSRATVSVNDLPVVPVPQAPHPASAPAKPRSRPRPACDPPYTVDSNGIRHLKSECL